MDADRLRPLRRGEADGVFRLRREPVQDVRPRGCRRWFRSLLWAPGAVGLLLLPALASAQAIGGTVTDATRAVLPGVTVEARSPALIEQVRTAVTDGAGQYKIVALETGAYSVTFKLPGFNTVVREGIKLTTGFTANVDAELAVSALEQTVTVTGASPTIDVQSIRASETVDQKIFETLPTTRGFDSLALLVPAMNIVGATTTTMSIDTGSIGGYSNARLSIHGSLQTDGDMQLNGIDINNVAFEGSPSTAPFDTGVQEYVYDYSGNSAEIETGGVRMNLIPKEGGNQFRGGMYATVSAPSWLSNNIDQKLIDRRIIGGKDGGVRLDQSWITAPSIGGPIARDRLWFFATSTFRRGSLFPPGFFRSKDTSAALYVPTVDKPTFERTDIYEVSVRPTWQVTSKDKVQAYWSTNHRALQPNLAGSGLDPLFIAPEAGSDSVVSANHYQISWVRPQTNRVLFEAGFAVQRVTVDNLALDEATELAHGRGNRFDARPDLYGTFEATTLTISRNQGFFFGGTEAHWSEKPTNFRASMSYVTGSHNLKVGITQAHKWMNNSYRSDNNWTNQITFNGNPVQAQFSARPNTTDELTNVGVYAQDQWTIRHFTVNAGLRFDYFKSFYPDQVTERMTWAPIPRSFPGMTVASWKDLEPRLGVAYDLTGNGRTALKASASRYGNRNGVGVSTAVNPVAKNILMPRAWLDGLVCLDRAVCIPGDGKVQGNPLLDSPNGEILDVNPTPGFASPTITDRYDPDYAFGWGKKPSNWEFSGSIQHELTTGLSVDAAYFRRVYVNLDAVDNESNNPKDWDRWTFMVPKDPRLPNGGGFPLTLVDLNPAAIGVPRNVTRSADNFGGRSQKWQGVDVNISARLKNTLLRGGYATGKQTTDDCLVKQALPERINQGAGGLTGGGNTVVPVEHCATETPWLRQASLYGSYAFPYDILLSGTFFTREGPALLAVIPIPNAVVTQALGRPPTQTSQTVNVIPPGSVYGDRLNQMDLRIAKVLHFGAPNVQVSLDVHNLFNGNAVSRESSTLVDYRRPVGLQPGRLFKVTAQFNF